METPDLTPEQMAELLKHAKQLAVRTEEHALAVIRSAHAELSSVEPHEQTLAETQAAIGRMLEESVAPEHAALALAKASGAIVMAVEQSFGVDGAEFLSNLETEYFFRSQE